MDKRGLTRKIKKEYAMTLVQGEFDYNKVLLQLMFEFDMSKRYTKEILDAAIFGVKNVIQ
jgi:hypothetical protein